MWEALLSQGEAVTWDHMLIRTLIMYFITLILIRIGGLRIIGKKSGFDMVIIIMLGAVLSRGLVGASSFPLSVMAGTVMVLINRLLAWMSIENPFLNYLFKGRSLLLYDNGEIIRRNMIRGSLSETDLMTSLRLETHSEDFNKVKKAYLEPNGRISFVMKD